jgi:hypothetical protein
MEKENDNSIRQAEKAFKESIRQAEENQRELNRQMEKVGNINRVTYSALDVSCFLVFL